jgi:hypothetical protein
MVMGDTRPTIPAGDIARKFGIPSWLRWLLDLVKGTRIQAGPVDILLDRRDGATPPRTGLDQPAEDGGGRWPL